jgi:hypothetical protein
LEIVTPDKVAQGGVTVPDWGTKIIMGMWAP